MTTTVSAPLAAAQMADSFPTQSLNGVPSNKSGKSHACNFERVHVLLPFGEKNIVGLQFGALPQKCSFGKCVMKRWSLLGSMLPFERHELALVWVKPFCRFCANLQELFSQISVVLINGNIVFFLTKQHRQVQELALAMAGLSVPTMPLNQKLKDSASGTNMLNVNFWRILVASSRNPPKLPVQSLDF